MIRRAIMLPPAVLLLVLVATLAGRAATFQTKAPYALLIDYNTGSVLFEKKADGWWRCFDNENLNRRDRLSRDCRGQTRARDQNADLAKGCARR
jgi:hypothetical protein